MTPDLTVLLSGFGAAVLLGGTALWASRRARRRRPSLKAELRPGGLRAVHLQADRAMAGRRPRALDSSDVHVFQVTGLADPTIRYVGIVSGDLRRVRCAEVWVNSENTEMQMARFDEFSVSSIIRYEGAVRDEGGRVVRDSVAEELEERVSGRRPVAPGTAVLTGPGELRRHGVRHIVHVAAVRGEPGSGYGQIGEVGRCVANVLAEVDGVKAEPAPESVLFPLLGAGEGGGDLEPTIRSLLGAAIDYLSATLATRVVTVYFLAYTDVELEMCEAVFGSHPRLLDGDFAVGTVVGSTPVAIGTGDGTGTGSGGRSADEIGNRNGNKAAQIEATAVERPAPLAPAPKKLQMGFVIDVVGYGARLAPAQEVVTLRLSRLLDQTLRDCGVGLDRVNHRWTGDGAMVFLPSDTDPSKALPDLIGSVAHRLLEDNERHEDRIRLRMAVGVGLIGPGAVGFVGTVTVDINRLLDSEPLRAAVIDNPDADLVVLVSDHVYSYVIRPGYPGLAAEAFHPVDVTVKEFKEPAWLWISYSGSREGP